MTFSICISISCKIYHKDFILIINIIIIKKDWQCKVVRERLTPYQSEDPSPTRATHKIKEDKKKTTGYKNGASSGAKKKSIDPAPETLQSHTIEYGVTKIVPH